MSRNKHERWDEEPDVRQSGYDSPESRRSRRPARPEDEWLPGSPAAPDQDEWRYGGGAGDAGRGGSSGSAGYPGSGSYSGPHSYPGQGGGYPDGAYQNDGYQNGAYQNGAYQNGAYQDGGYQDGGYQDGGYQDSTGYGSYRNEDYGGSGYGGGLTDPLGRNDPPGMTDPRGMTDPYGRTDPRGMTDPYGRTDPRGMTDPRGHSGPHGEVELYRAADSYGPGYDSAGYGSAGHNGAGYNGAGYDADSPGWTGRGDGEYGHDSGSYGSYGDSGSYGGQGQYGGPAAYAAGNPYEGHGAAGPGGGPAAEYEYGGGYDDHGYDPGGGRGEHDQYPDGEAGYGGYAGEGDFWRAPVDDTRMTRRRDRGGEPEIDPDDARHNNFFRGFGRGDDDYSHRPPKKRRRSKAGLVALSVIIVFLAVVVAGGLYGYNWYAKRHADWKGSAGYGSVMVQVMPGAIACGAAMENTLVSKGVVASATAFCDAAKSAGNSASLEPGYFRLRKHMSAQAAWAMITNPKSRVQTTVAVPDGLRASKIIAILAAKTGIPLSQFQSALKNDVSQLGLPSWAKGNYEGFLYPATYPIQPGTSALNILKTMVAKFNSEILSLNLAAKAKADHFNNEYEVIIEASLLEGEVGPQYYRQVARVIDNRLNQHWYLGLDSTVAYALNKYIYNLSQSDLNTRSLYNTTKHYGLPPGPIDSPDLTAIEAVLHPVPDNSYMYFVTVNKAGKTLFTSSSVQFNQWAQEAIRNGV
jgi:UPF0755 protein